MIGRFGIVLAVAAGLLPVAGAAQQDPYLGPLARVAASQIAPPWTGAAEQDWYVLRNDTGDDAEVIVSTRAGHPPPSGRTVFATVSVAAEQPTASVGVILVNFDQNASCVAEINAAGQANLFCAANGTSETIATYDGAARMDGTDTLAVEETAGVARFYLNGELLGEVNDKPAFGGEVGIVAYDIGAFGVTGFAIRRGTGLVTVPPPSNQTAGEPQQQEAPAGEGDELSAILGPLAPVVNAKPLRAGWQTYLEEGWFVLENPAAPNDSFGYAAETGPPGPDGRIAYVNAALTAPAGMASETLEQSSVGIVLQNRDTQNSCVGEITGTGDGVLTCFYGDETVEIGRMVGVARLDGSDQIVLIEKPGTAQFLVNDQVIGELADSPAQGGQIGVLAYNLGRFHVTGFDISDLEPEGGQGSQTGGAVAQGDPAGPLPMFDGDSARITSTYLGVITGIFLHEFGHALIGELQLPSTGPEEDAVDIFSALRISSPGALDGGDSEANAINESMATYAAVQWYYMGMAGQQAAAETAWQDEHTADLKRFRNSFCVMYGGNPQLFGGVAEQVGMEERTLSRCEDEFVKQNRAWRTILAPHTRISAYYPEGLAAADAPGAKVEVVFEPSSRNVGNFVKTIIGDSGTKQEYVDGLAADYVLPRPIRVIYKDCGELNAWYDPVEGTVTMCYDLIEYVVVMISDIEMGTVGGFAAGGDGSARQGGTPARTQSPGGGEAAEGTAAPAFDELADMGVPVTPVLFPAPYNGPTPNGIAEGRIVTTGELAGLIDADTARVMVDTRGGTETLPEAIVITDAGRDGSLTDGFQQAMASFLQEQTGGDTNRTIVFFGAGPMDRTAYNAALRAARLGYPNVLWYRGGREAWVANGYALVASQ